MTRSEDIKILNTKEVTENLDVDFFVQAVVNGDTIILPNSIVESTLTTYQSNISQEIGYEV